MNTIENNKIIAEFMVLRPKSELDGVYSYSDMPFVSIRENDIKKVWRSALECVKYSSDWNWLMPVVDKCSKKSDDLNASSLFKVELWMFLTNEIELVCNSCLEFIKWHNEQNK